MKLSVATAILGKAYLKSKNMSTYDLRCFEYYNGNKQMTKIPSLLEATKFLTLSELEQEAYNILEDSNAVSVENDMDYVKELIK